MNILDVIFGLNGSDKADKAYERNRDCLKETTRVIRTIREQEEQALSEVGEMRSE